MDRLSVLLVSAICGVVCICSGVVYAAWIDEGEPQQYEKVEEVRVEEETAVIAMNDNAQVINGGGADMWVRAKVKGTLTEGKRKIGLKTDQERGDWHLKQDGYYYYSTPVRPGEQSEPLFTDADNKSQGKEKRISIQAEAIQINWISQKA